MKGKLYITATPIGNLSDITLRAIETLKQVDQILCEDTRTTQKLLQHYNISKELISLNAVNEQKKINFVINKLNEGLQIALVSDAGTPGISDPGIRLINAAIKAGYQPVPVPGVTALITALSIAGLPTDSFVFEGFLPQKKGRQKLISGLADETRTIVLYESTYRIEKLLHELNNYLPERFIVICRELTKMFEETWRGKPQEILDSLQSRTIKGEFVILIAPRGWTE
ncbi:MAG: 16S rRNA (cytidine(1402)-2'-O)-methyltransferase [Ignavibacteriaceae bacterium]